MRRRADIWRWLRSHTLGLQVDVATGKILPLFCTHLIEATRAGNVGPAAFPLPKQSHALAAGLQATTSKTADLQNSIMHVCSCCEGWWGRAGPGRGLQAELATWCVPDMSSPGFA